MSDQLVTKTQFYNHGFNIILARVYGCCYHTNWYCYNLATIIRDISSEHYTYVKTGLKRGSYYNIFSVLCTGVPVEELGLEWKLRVGLLAVPKSME